MTPKTQSNPNNDSRLSVEMDSEAKARTDRNGRFHIRPLEIVNGEMDFGSYKQKTLRFICQSAYMNREGVISVCKNPCKTVVGGGTGDQTEIIECGHCRTQYIIRTRYNEQGNVNFSTSVWAIGRKVEEKGKLWTDRNDWESYIKFGSGKK